MLKYVVGGVVVALAAAAAVQDEMKKAPAEKEHLWLKQLAGQWDCEIEATMAPGQPATKIKGAESSRMIGDFWYFAENTGAMMNEPFTGLMTIGYSPEKKKYVGTWTDNMTSYLWIYEGTVDAGGKILTLESEGPCPMKPGKMFKFKDIVEIKDADHKTFTSMMLDDGKWTTMMVGHCTRKK
jgi:hypothetical protein